MLRDLLAGEIPQLVLPGPINYLAAILGAIIYVGMVNWAHLDKVLSEWVTIAIVFGLRMLALKFDIKAPEPVDVPRHLRRSVLTGRKRTTRPGMRVYRTTPERTAPPGGHDLSDPPVPPPKPRDKT